MPATAHKSEIVRYPRVMRWTDLIHLSDDELAKYDVAAINLACAAGLPGAEVIDVEGCLNCLDKWALGIAEITRKGLETEFRANPGRYEHSEPLYRMVTLVLGLKQFCGVQYNPAKIGLKPEDPFDLDEQFVYGAIQGPGGTCATLPVLYAAVGRRLGYPVKIVHARGHLFCRWDDAANGVRFNIEGTTQDGVNDHPDDHYRKWPYPFTPEEERRFGLLRSLTPRQELADFIGCRANQWRERNNYRRAIQAALVAMAIDERTEGRAIYGHAIQNEWHKKLMARKPKDFPSVSLVVPPWETRWPGMPREAEMFLRFLEATELLLDDPELEAKWWGPMRAGRPPLTPVPKEITFRCSAEASCSIHP